MMHISTVGTENYGIFLHEQDMIREDRTEAVRKYKKDKSMY